MSYVVLRADAEAGLLVGEGDEVEDGQPLGKAIARDSLVLAPVSGVVRFVQLNADCHCLLVYVEAKRSRPGSLCVCQKGSA